MCFSRNDKNVIRIDTQMRTNIYASIHRCIRMLYVLMRKCTTYGMYIYSGMGWLRLVGFKL